MWEAPHISEKHERFVKSMEVVYKAWKVFKKHGSLFRRGNPLYPCECRRQSPITDQKTGNCRRHEGKKGDEASVCSGTSYNHSSSYGVGVVIGIPPSSWIVVVELEPAGILAVANPRKRGPLAKRLHWALSKETVRKYVPLRHGMALGRR